MPYVESRDGTRLYVTDWGSGPAVVLIHGWPLNADSWEAQHAAIAAQGFRVVAYDRRGFGRSDKPWTGYDYDTFADDLAAVIDGLGLTDVTLAGFSMGGGEVARYLGRHGRGKVARAALLGAVTPFLLETPDHPGAPKSLFEGMIAGIEADRAKFFEEFFPNFFGVGTPGGKVSEATVRWAWSMAMQAALPATTGCVRAFGATDFRPDMAAFEGVPTLVVHGDADAIVPIDITAREAVKAIPGAELVVYEGAPHGFLATHAERVNADLLRFLRS
jgi:pimeloyl-ACP methyl ester carboxylesterase